MYDIGARFFIRTGIAVAGLVAINRRGSASVHRAQPRAPVRPKLPVRPKSYVLLLDFRTTDIAVAGWVVISRRGSVPVRRLQRGKRVGEGEGREDCEWLYL